MKNEVQQHWEIDASHDRDIGALMRPGECRLHAAPDRHVDEHHGRALSHRGSESFPQSLTAQPSVGHRHERGVLTGNCAHRLDQRRIERGLRVDLATEQIACHELPLNGSLIVLGEVFLERCVLCHPLEEPLVELTG